MRLLIAILTCVYASVTAFAQEGTLTGKVSTVEGDPLTNVNVFILNTKKGGQTKDDGTFTIKNVPTGEQIINISLLGFQTKRVSINVTSGTTNIPEVLLYEGNELLEEVVINGDRTNKFSRKKSAYVSKLPLKNIENSQVYSTVTNELLVSQTVTSFEDALKNATGVEQLWSSTGRGGDGAGYYTLRGFNVQPQLVNGLPGLTNGKINPSNIERIEVVKGPSATLFGSTVTSYGGLINVVTKKPFAGFGGDVSYTTGNYGFNRIAADVNTALDKKNDIYVRLNTAYHTQESFQDNGFNKSFSVAPSLSYRVNDKLSFYFYGEISQYEQTNPTFLFLNRSVPLKWSNLEELNYNYKKSLTSNELTIANPTANYRAEADYKFSDKWRSQTIVSTSKTRSNGYYSYLWNDEYSTLVDPIVQAQNPLARTNPNTGTFSLRTQRVNSMTQTVDVQQNIIGDFKVGSMRNRMVIGADFYNTTIVNNSTGFAFVHNVNPQGEIVNYDNPDTDDFNPLTTADIESTVNPLTRPGIDKLLANAAVANTKTEQNVYSAYISDVLDILPTLSVMAGGRIDVFENRGNLNAVEDKSKFNQTTFSPKFGAVFQPIKDQLSVFANYQNGFSNVPVNILPNNVQTFRPEQANQIEFGAKTNLFNDRLTATISYYSIKVSDKVYTDPNDNNPADGINRVQDGEMTSKGFEIELNAQPINGLNLRAGYSHNTSELVKGDAKLVGRRPNESGPESLFNFWADYRIPTGKFTGLGFGAGFNGASERFIMNDATVGQFKVPSYTIANGTIYYDTDKFRVGVKLNNAFNKIYYKGWTTINPQQPRTVFANFTYKF